MFRSGLFAFRCLVVTGTLFSIPLFAGENQKETVLSAPIPADIVNGKKAFIAYPGVGSSYLSNYIISYAGRANGLYDEFYAAIKSWGKYELVSRPGDADLVLEISIVNTSGAYPDFRLRIVDAKTHIILWALAENVNLAGRKASRVKHWDQALGKLVTDLKVLTVGPEAAGAQEFRVAGKS